MRSNSKRALRLIPFLWALLALAAVLPYAGTLHHDFAWDDKYIISHIGNLSDGGGLPAVLSAPFLPQPGVPDMYYRPVVYLSFWLDNLLGRGSPLMFHLTNILLNMACVLLCMILFRRIIPDDFPAFAGSLLFALHPSHVESVAFISGRTDLLAALFILLASLAWMKSHDASGERKPRLMAVAWSGLAFLLASLSKENAVVLPVLFVAWDLWDAKNRKIPGAGWWRRNLPWMRLYGLALAVFFALRFAVLSPVSGGTASMGSAGSILLDQPGVAATGLLHLMRMLLLPWPHNALITRMHIAPDILSATAAGAACALIAWAIARRPNPAGIIGGTWTAAFLAPAFLLPSIGVVVIAERFLYLPSIGFCLVVSALLFRMNISGLPGKATLVAVSMCALALGYADFHRAAVWRDDVTLGNDLVRTSPASALAHNRLGQGLVAAGRYREAFGPLQKAVSLEPSNPAYHNGMGIALRRLNQPALAAESFRRSLQLDPDAVGTRLNLAYACMTMGDLPCVEEQRQYLATVDPRALRILEQVLDQRRR